MQRYSSPVNKLLEILKLLSKYQVKNKNDRKFIRVKKRINNNKFNNRKKITMDKNIMVATLFYLIIISN